MTVAFKTVFAVPDGNVTLKSNGENKVELFSGAASSSWSVNVDGLRPGTPYEVWISVPKMNRTGEWTTKVDPNPVTTWHRKVTVSVPEMFVFNDSDDSGCGEPKW